MNVPHTVPFTLIIGTHIKQQYWFAYNKDKFWYLFENTVPQT